MDQNEKEANDIAKALIDRMQEAVDLDREANENRQPALRRLLMANEVYSKLRKNQIQEKFLENGGCRVLSQWLD